MKRVVAERALVTVALVAAAAGCKAGKWRDKESAQASHTASAPVRATGADATAAVPGPYVDVDDKSGKLKAELVLRLDFFPEPKPGAASLPVCFEPLESTFDLGFIMCEGKPEAKQALTAGNLLQECYTQPTAAKVPAVKALSLVGCKRAVVLAHVFQPRLKIDVEAKDVAAQPVAPAPTP